MTLAFKTIGCALFQGRTIIVSRDQHGKFHIDDNARCVQQSLNATETVRWLLNAMEGK